MNTIERLEQEVKAVRLGLASRDIGYIISALPALLAVAKAADHLDYVWTMRASDLIHHSESSKTFDRTSQANAELKLTQALAALREGK